MRGRFQFVFVVVLWLAGCGAEQSTSPQSSTPQVSPAATSDPLPSWNDGDSKKAVMDFVARVAREGASTFVPPSERIATFDNDGTLWGSSLSTSRSCSRWTGS